MWWLAQFAQDSSPVGTDWLTTLGPAAAAMVVALMFIAYQRLDNTELKTRIKEKDAQIQKLNDEKAEVAERVIPVFAEATRVLGKRSDLEINLSKELQRAITILDQRDRR